MAQGGDVFTLSHKGKKGQSWNGSLSRVNVDIPCLHHAARLCSKLQHRRGHGHLAPCRPAAPSSGPAPARHVGKGFSRSGLQGNLPNSEPTNKAQHKWNTKQHFNHLEQLPWVRKEAPECSLGARQSNTHLGGGRGVKDIGEYPSPADSSACLARLGSEVHSPVRWGGRPAALPGLQPFSLLSAQDQGTEKMQYRNRNYSCRTNGKQK